MYRVILVGTKDEGWSFISGDECQRMVKYSKSRFVYLAYMVDTHPKYGCTT